MKRTRVVLADDHLIVLQGLRALLMSEPEMQVVGEVSEGLQVADRVCQLSPDVLILDLMMPGLNGLEVTRQVHKRFPQVRIIVLSMHASPAYVLEALRHGAVGYVLKDSSTEDLVTAIRNTMNGTRYLSPALAAVLPAALSQEALQPASDPYDTVTAREREVLQLSAEGHTNEDIAQKLSISRRTAELHRTHILEKLRLRNQTGLVKFAIRKGLVSL